MNNDMEIADRPSSDSNSRVPPTVQRRRNQREYRRQMQQEERAREQLQRQAVVLQREHEQRRLQIYVDRISAMPTAASAA